MKIAFFSNFLNHHQLPLCNEFMNSDNVEFIFVATEAIPFSRIQMGYEDMNEYPFVIRSYESEIALERAYKIAEDFDIVIFGACPISFLEARMKKNKLSFRFCERPFKKGTWRRFIPTTRKKIYNGYLRFKEKKLYILGASSYTAYDLSLCGFPKEKCFKWGYFPKIEEKNVKMLLKHKEENVKVEILYAGRLLKLKRVIDTLKAARILVKKNITNFHITIVGDGPEKQTLMNFVNKNGLNEYVDFLPFMSPDEVRTYMDKADIYVFGSNFYEGWGAVMNEAMNSACVPVVSHSVGSAAFLVDNGKNGYIYKLANIKELANLLQKLVSDKGLRQKLGTEAYKTITTTWSAKTAASRLLELCESLENEKCNKVFFESGPCSKGMIDKRG